MMNFPKPDKATLLAIYRRVTLIKQNDEQVIKLAKAGRLVSPYYSTRGQEIIPSAISVSLTDEDYVCTVYRGTHDMLAKGVPLTELWGELAGRVTGTCKGKGGPMHVTHPETGIMVTTGIVGSTAPIANGLAWASLLRGDGRVTIANFGDGAANIGAVHEAMNMAGLWKLPVIFVCQNNRYAEHTSFRNSTPVEKLSSRAAGYGIEGITVNGNDPEEMYGAAKLAIDRARAGEGPTFIEALTFRFNGHLLGDMAEYIPRDELKAALENDPVPKFRSRLIADGIANEDTLAAIDTAAHHAIEAASEAALAAPFPDIIELKRDVYAHEIA